MQTVEENASTNKHAQRLPCERLRSNAEVFTVHLAGLSFYTGHVLGEGSRLLTESSILLWFETDFAGG